MPIPHSTLLALDVGTKRIGIALARSDVRLASPLTTLENDADFTERLQQLISIHQVSVVVLGLPRGLNSQDTAQTAYVRQFAQKLQRHIAMPLAFQDEALTSRKAEAELRDRKKAYTKGDIDALSATYILEDFLREGV